MVIQLEKGSLGPALQNIGSILGQALQQRAQLQQQGGLAQQNQIEKQQKAIANTYKQAGQYAKQFNLDYLPPEQFSKIVQYATALQNQGLDPDQSIIQAYQALENNSIDQLLQPQQPQVQGGSPFGQALTDAGAQREDAVKKSIFGNYGEAFTKGTESGIPGRIAAILRGEGEEAFQKGTELEDPNFLQRLIHSTGKFAGESPFYAGGGALGGALGTAVGGPIGTVVGSGAGALALPAMVETGLSEYQKYLDKGGKGTFEDFIISAGKVGQAGVIGGAEGATLGTLGKLIGPLKRIPAFKKLFEIQKGGKVLEKTAQGAIQSAGLLGSKAAAQQQLPSGEQVADTFAQVIGLNLLGMSPKSRKNITEKVIKSEVAPEVFAENIRQQAKELGKDLTKEKDVLSLVNRISKEKPSVLNERISRTAIEAEPGKAAQESKIREEQLSYGKRTPSAREEISSERERVSKRERPKVKSPEVFQRQSSIRKSAREALPAIERDLREINQEYKNIRDELNFARKSNVSQGEINKLENSFDRLKSLRNDALEKVKKYKVEEKTGNEYIPENEINKKAFQDAENITERIKTKGEAEILKENSLDALAKKLSGRRTVPGQEKISEDTFDRIQRIYEKQYERKLDNVKTELRREGLSRERRSDLEKARDILEKLIEQKKGRYRVGRRRKGLQQMGKTIEKAGQLPERISKEVAGRKVKKSTAFKNFDVPEKKISEESVNLEKEISRERQSARKEGVDRKSDQKSTSSSPSGFVSDLVKKAVKKVFNRDISTSGARLLLALGGQITGSSLGLTPKSLALRISDVLSSLKMLSMDEREKALYLRNLKNKGVSSQRLKRINSGSKRILNEDTIEKIFG